MTHEINSYFRVLVQNYENIFKRQLTYESTSFSRVRSNSFSSEETTKKTIKEGRNHKVICQMYGRLVSNKNIKLETCSKPRKKRETHMCPDCPFRTSQAPQLAKHHDRCTMPPT